MHYFLLAFLNQNKTRLANLLTRGRLCRAKICKLLWIKSSVTNLFLLYLFLRLVWSSALEIGYSGVTTSFLSIPSVDGHLVDLYYGLGGASNERMLGRSSYNMPYTLLCRPPYKLLGGVFFNKSYTHTKTTSSHIIYNHPCWPIKRQRRKCVFRKPMFNKKHWKIQLFIVVE